MARVIVTTDHPRPRARVLLEERVATEHLSSAHFAAQLLERVAWAVADAAEAPEPPAGGPPASWTPSEP